MNNVLPFVIGTDITQLSRWRFETNPRKYARLARRILHPGEIHDLWMLKPDVAKALFPQVFLDLEDNVRLYSKREQVDEFTRALRRPFHIAMTRKPYEDLLESPTTQRRVSTFLAGRWAAKEAAKKAWSAHLIGWHDLRVKAASNAHHSSVAGEMSRGLQIQLRPYLDQAILARVRNSFDRKPELFSEDDALTKTTSLSISHDGDYAIATVVATPLEGLLWSVLRERYRNLHQYRTATKLGYGELRPPQGPSAILDPEEPDEAEGDDDVEDGEEEQPTKEDEHVPWWKHRNDEKSGSSETEDQSQIVEGGLDAFDGDQFPEIKNQTRSFEDDLEPVEVKPFGHD